jgi:hypothetical protein
MSYQFPYNMSAPSSEAVEVTPSDSTPVLFRSLYIGGGGNVRVVPFTGGPVTFHNVPAGTILPIIVVRVNSTGTTATNIVGLK